MIKFCGLSLMVTSIMTLLTLVYGSCFFSPAQITVIGSKEMVTCEYEGVKFLEGSTFKTTDCFSCDCSIWGLDCCGFGINAGAIDVESGYKVVQYGCDFKIEIEED